MNESDFNEHKTPNGGWQFRQPEIKWAVLNPISKTLNQATMELIAQRKKNPALTAKFQWATNYEAVKSEVIRFNRKRLGLSPEATPQAFRVLPSNQSAKAVGAAGAKTDAMSGLKRAAQGTGVVLAWLGSGAVPVAQELAEKRAATCMACSMNQPGDWYTTAPAEILKKSVEAWKTMTGKTDFKFENSQGDKLKSCQVCRCLLPLKIFVPLEHIIAKTPEEVMGELPKTCWIANRDA